MRFSVLTLRVEVLGNRPDWPVVSISVDGKNPFEYVATDWRGFDPTEILGADSPLVPDDGGRRVAVYRCSCGEAGCGVIAPYVVPSPDRTRISWVAERLLANSRTDSAPATPTGRTETPAVRRADRPSSRERS